MGTDDPGAEGYVVRCCDGGVGEIGLKRVGGVTHGGDFVFGELAASGMESAVGEVNATDRAESQVEDESEESVTRAARQAHGLRKCTGGGAWRFRGIGRIRIVLKPCDESAGVGGKATEKTKTLNHRGHRGTRRRTVANW